MDTQISSGSFVDNFVEKINSFWDNFSGSSLELPKDIKQILYRYIDFGWQIIPNYGIYKKHCNCKLQEKCSNPGKHPRYDKNGKALSTNDKKVIDEWLNDRYIKYSNWAVKCGKESGIIAFDIDAQHGGKREDLKDYPPTMEYRTQGGGYRLIYQLPVDYEIKANDKFLEGIELKVNTQITLPPSEGKIGYYRWIYEIPPAKLPKEFYDLGNKKTNENGGYILPDEPISYGRNPALAELRKFLMDSGFKQDLAHIIISDVNQQLCDLPKPQSEIDFLVDYGYKKYQTGKDSNGIYNNPEPRFQLKGIKDIFKPREKRKYIIDQMIQEGTLNLWVGKFGSKKTYSAIVASVSVATGNDFIGLKTTKSPILFIDEESGDYLLSERFQKIIGDDYNEDLPVNYMSLSGFNFHANTEDPQKLKEIILQTNAKLVFIDTLAAIMSGGNENEVSTIQPIFKELRKICEETNCAIVVLHHTNKQNEYRGSTAIAGAIDTMVKIESEFTNNFIKFKSEKVREGIHFTFNAEIHFDENEVWMEESESSPFDNKPNYQKEILDYCQKNNEELVLSEFLNSVSPDKKSGYKTEIYRMAKDDKTIEKDPDSTYGHTKYKLVNSFK